MLHYFLDKPKVAYDRASRRAGKWYSRASDRASDAYDEARERGSDWFENWRPHLSFGRQDEEWTAGDIGSESTKALLWMALGAGLMYFFDPQQGRRRRAVCLDKLFSAGRSTGEAVAGTGSYVGHWTSGKAEGAAASLRRMYRGDEPVSDEKLIARVRSEIGRHVSHPGSIQVTAHNGLITLSGPVIAGEVDALISAVEGVAGVQFVDNRLDVHPSAGNVPGLQGEGRVQS